LFTYCLLLGLGLILNNPSLPYVCDDLPDYSEYHIYLTAYDPELGGHNCMEPCGFTALGFPVEEWYDFGAGCPVPLLSYGVNVIIKGRTFTCIDTGGAVLVDDKHKFIRVDLLRRLTYNGEYSINRDDPWLHDTNVVDFAFVAIPHWRSKLRRNYNH
jgi:hypothetical protein